MASPDELFNKAAEDVKKLKVKPSQEDLLELYGLYKQATMGDNSTDKPGMLDFKGKAKWEAWTNRKGMAQDAAKKAYVEVADKMINKYGIEA